MDRRSAGRRLARAVAEPDRAPAPVLPPMSVFDAVKRANRPGPPEHSITLRVACAGAVITGIAACRAESELSWTVAAAARSCSSSWA